MKRQALLTGIACGFILNAAYVIVDTARNHRPAPVRLPTNTYPIIPDCDAELWDRIKDGCSE